MNVSFAVSFGAHEHWELARGVLEVIVAASPCYVLVGTTRCVGLRAALAHLL